jgi:uracil-DNA glycosylase
MDRTEALKMIRDEVVALTSGELAEYRREQGYFPVIGEGAHAAEVVLVGEAPGEKEAKSGRPFCGAAGKLLETMIQAVGWERSQLYITNLVKDRPPENRDPSPQEIELYGPWLMRQINIIQPKVVASLGRYSLQYLQQEWGLAQVGQTISALHGQELRAVADYGPVVLMPLYHPAAALYNGGLRETLLADFQKLAKVVREQA